MPEIFINYRTGDGNEMAALLDQALTARFGEDSVFFAGRSIRGGEFFPQELLTHVRRCKVLLAVIGPSWATDPGLRESDDWVRMELLEALRCGVHVIPVLKGRHMERLSGDMLPPELAPLAARNSLRIDSQSHHVDTKTIGDELAWRLPELVGRCPVAVSDCPPRAAWGTLRPRPSHEPTRKAGSLVRKTWARLLRAALRLRDTPQKETPCCLKSGWAPQRSGGCRHCACATPHQCSGHL
ncbi:toll/interleukin-1 receptor domain-containing protein [Streptomyces laurentii]|uniref:toll/interleukin-1 receptor domain-containing protein n=1 Tax=Streptomyces laurentii TaxID=39478 RepID=UPI0033DA0282